MAHLQLTYGGSETQMVLDGVDITKAVLVDGFAIDFGKGDGKPAVVSMKVRVDRVDVDLPDAVLEAVVASSDRTETDR